MRISCPDATGLGCDIARLLLDFGLRIMDGELVFTPCGCLHRMQFFAMPVPMECRLQACLPANL